MIIAVPKPGISPEESLLPVLYHIGNYGVPSYDVFLTIAALVGVWIGWREAKSFGYTSQQLAGFFIFVVPLAFLMGLVNGVLFSRGFYQRIAQGHLDLGGGLVSYGIVFTAFVTIIAFHKKNGGPLGKTLDSAAIVLAVILGITRIGCFLNGCCYGLVTAGFGGIYLPDVYGEWAYRYPTQLMLLALDSALFIGLWYYRRRGPADGSVAIAFLFWFGLGRLLIDSLRDIPSILGPFSFHQLMDMAIIIGAVALMAWRRRAPDQAPTATTGA